MRPREVRGEVPQLVNGIRIRPNNLALEPTLVATLLKCFSGVQCRKVGCAFFRFQFIQFLTEVQK